MALRIEDYALVGDCETAALIGRDGSVDWLCWPRFDSAACFAALLGGADKGRWVIEPRSGPATLTRRYRDRTLILETAIETPAGAASLVEFMPPRGKASDLVRLVVGRRGTVDLRTELVVRFEYGALFPWITRDPREGLLAVSGPDMVVLRTPVALGVDNGRISAEFSVSAGEAVPFVLTYGPSFRPPPQAIDPARALADAEAFWLDWCGQVAGAGECGDEGVRSLITLKALTYRPTGGIVAAPTTSLPEELGGSRNWDYRFCWLRDATFTLLAMMNCGFYQEARAWRAWLLRALAGDPSQVQIMYGLAGEHRLTEWEVPGLAGYGRSRPVRVGNAAAAQRQLDIYGEVVDALYHGRAGRLGGDGVGWDLQRGLLDHLEGIWREPDEGIWEVRGGARQFTYSKVMAWVAFDRAIRSVERYGLAGPVDRWRRLRGEIHDEVCRQAFNPQIGAFTQSYGSTELDASVLLLPLVGFLPPGDPRMQGTVAAIERRLMRGGLVLRYDPDTTRDGLDGREGAFLACSFWLADNLVLQGRHDDARRLYDRLLGLRNDLGLLSEEYDPQLGRMLGNFPQAFSHIALVNTTHNLGRRSRPAEQRSGHPAG